MTRQSGHWGAIKSLIRAHAAFSFKLKIYGTCFDGSAV